MTKLHITVYTLLAIACGLAYPLGKVILIQQEPIGHIVVSNITINYILMFVMAGAISPWLSTRLPFLRRHKKQTASGIVMVTLVSLLLIILTLAGMSMRWS